ncbi:MAG: SCO family protein [Chitinophagaceae bacterium]
MNKKALIGIVIALIIPLAIFLFVNALPKAAIPRPVFYDSIKTVVKKGKQYTDTFWHHISDGKFVNQLGQEVKLSDILFSDSGRIIVANFFFTHCPNICPGMTQTMRRLQQTVTRGESVGDTMADYVQFISFSIDPERDSVAALKKWADRFGVDPSNWWLLRGDTTTIYNLSREMKLTVMDPKIDSSFPHTDIFVLIDKKGVIRARRDQFGNPMLYHSGDSTDMANLAEDIVLLSLEKNKKNSFLQGQLTTIAVALLIAFVAVGVFIYFFKKKEVR